jgi:hypothetical protein
MDSTDKVLPYATPTRERRRSALPAILVALAGCPVASAAAAVFGCQQAIGGWPLSSANFTHSAALGTFAGLIGGGVVAVLTASMRSDSLAASITGSVWVAAITGISMYFLAAMAAAC